MRLIPVLVLMGSTLASLASGNTMHWPQFRGAGSDGLVQETKAQDKKPGT